MLLPLRGLSETLSLAPTAQKGWCPGEGPEVERVGVGDWSLLTVIAVVIHQDDFFYQVGRAFLKDTEGRKIQLQAFQGCDAQETLIPWPQSWMEEPQLLPVLHSQGPVCSPRQPLPGCAGHLPLVRHPCWGCLLRLWVGTGGSCRPHLTTVLRQS